MARSVALDMVQIVQAWRIENSRWLKNQEMEKQLIQLLRGLTVCGLITVPLPQRTIEQKLISWKALGREVAPVREEDEAGLAHFVLGFLKRHPGFSHELRLALLHTLGTHFDVVTRENAKDPASLARALGEHVGFSQPEPLVRAHL